MRIVIAGLGLALAAMFVAPAPAIAQVDNDPALGSHIQQGRKGPPSNQPLKRDKLDKAVEKIFKQVDGNRDGLLTLDEFNAEIDARKDAIIAERFDDIDRNHDHSLSQAEFTDWQRSLGSVVLRDPRKPAETKTDIVPEVLYVDLGNDRIDQALEQLIAPVSAKLIVEGNTDYDAGLSLAELQAYQGARFDAVDENKDGWLTSAEFEGLPYE